ncbi:hypothetical protein AB0E88_04270 [Streptomyces sp. NPDC028635]|uniref:hypothetical protein n=1 Tax=Streptomyces sp. NPDC028635 TaxID=3154800 RepID=UPI003401D921
MGPAGTAAQAVAMVVERLPPGCGFAFHGTPDELAVHEKGATECPVLIGDAPSAARPRSRGQDLRHPRPPCLPA